MQDNVLRGCVSLALRSLPLDTNRLIRKLCAAWRAAEAADRGRKGSLSDAQWRQRREMITDLLFTAPPVLGQAIQSVCIRQQLVAIRFHGLAEPVMVDSDLGQIRSALPPKP